MTPLQLVFLLISLFLDKTALMDFSQHTTLHQDKGFIVVDVGNNLTFVCSYKNSSMSLWFKQTLDQRLELIATIIKYSRTGHFNGKFKDDPRFSLQNTEGDNHLKISHVQLSDTATYFCAHGDFSEAYTFEKGTTVRVKGSAFDVKVSVDGSASQSLNCTVFTGGCWDQTSVNGLKIPNETRTPQCLRIPRSNQHTCLYNKMTRDHIKAGFNFCAVASCGHKLFRNTPVSHIQGEKKSNTLLYLLIGGLAFTTISILILAFILHTLIQKSRNQRTEFQPISSSSSTNAEEILHYAAVNVHQPRRTRRQRNTINNECVYSRVRH